MKPIDILLMSLCKQSMEWERQFTAKRPPIFTTREHDAVEIGCVDLRDYPTYFESLPNGRYRLTAEARRRYLSMPRRAQ